MKSYKKFAGAWNNGNLWFNRLPCKFDQLFVIFVELEQNNFQILCNPDIMQIVYLETGCFMFERKCDNQFHKLV